MDTIIITVLNPPHINHGDDIVGTISEEGETDYSGYTIAVYGVLIEGWGRAQHYGPAPGTATVDVHGNFTISGWSKYNIGDAKLALIAYPNGKAVSYNGEIVYGSTIITRVNDVTQYSGETTRVV